MSEFHQMFGRLTFYSIFQLRLFCLYMLMPLARTRCSSIDDSIVPNLKLLSPFMEEVADDLDDLLDGHSDQR